MISLKKTSVLLICLGGLLPAATGCQTPPPHTPHNAGAYALNPQASRAQVAGELTARARDALESGNAQEALGLLERAVSLAPQYAESYYWLAEAWILEDNLPQAREYHELAAIYLEGWPEWEKALSEQKKSLEADEE
jgi:Tfp pilus assembly protein PilF